MSESSMPMEWIDRIFVRMHGRFGNQFFDKFRLGQLGQSGEDLGIENAKSVWADELAGFTVDEIKRGLSARFSFPPSCDEFRLACRPHEPKENDGRYTADEAWAKLPKDDNYGALVTNEMNEAAGFAWPLLQMGDKIAARRAFIDAYERIVNNARLLGNKPVWSVSAGLLGGNAEAAAEGLKKGVLKTEQLYIALKPDEVEYALSIAGVQLALPAPTEKGKQYALEAKKLLQQIGGKIDETD